jgi:hypothetical protein
LFWGRTRNRPNALFGSRQGTTEYENFDKSRPLKASDSFDLAMTGKRVNTINQVVPSDQLLALTTDGIFQIDGDGQGGVLTATQRAARKIVGRGASRLEPIVIDNVVFHTPAVGSAIRTLGYSFEFDGIRSNDVSIFSPHLFEGHLIVSWCYVEFPHSRIWAARDDGVLLCLTWEQEQQVWGITRHETDGLVKWVASISEEGEDRLYLAVERRVGSQNQVLIERMASALEVAREDQCFCDSAISYAYDDARASFTNLHHLNGRTDVVGLIDGVAIAGLTVVNGILTLPNGLTARRATFGLPYTADVQTLPLRVSDRDGGSAVGKRQQSATIVYDLSGTGPGIEAGATFGTLYPVKNRTDETYGGPLSYLNGRYEVETANTLGDEAEACLRSALPYPLTLLGVYVDPLTAD